MKLIRALLVTGVLALVTSAASAASAAQVLQRVITQANVVDVSGVPMLVVKVQGGVHL